MADETDFQNRIGSQFRDTGHTYTAEDVIGKGSFGSVFKTKVNETGEIVAIKKVFQDRRYKNRELPIMEELNHPNVIYTKHAFFTPADKEGDVYLNLVMDYHPTTAYRMLRGLHREGKTMPFTLVKLYAYQLLRSIAYTHGIGVCHRDIKPQNLLIDTEHQVMKLCDYGSAKKLDPAETNVNYICSRYYRAPELVFGSSNYTNSIDVWSAGCVIGELILKRPVFPGDTGVDQIVEIMKILGTPSREQVKQMNPLFDAYSFPGIKSTPLHKIFPPETPRGAIHLLQSLLVYEPEKRPAPLAALAHEFFDELRQ